MKKFFTALTVALIVTFSAHCSAMQVNSVTGLKYIVGNWYDAKGNLVLTISNDYKFNGCTILSVKGEQDNDASFEIRIDEGNRYRDIKLHDAGAPEGYHRRIILNDCTNNEIMLRSTKEPSYFESVGGIYLGMHKDDVAKLYGQPLSVENGRWTLATWKYRGFDVRFRGEVVNEITIYKNSDRRFDWSGLSANSSLSDFKYKYSSDTSGRDMIIRHGEYIVVKDNKVSLKFYSP